MPETPIETNALSPCLYMTLREWIERYQREIIFERVHCRGVSAWKNALDLWICQEIIWETNVEVAMS